MYEQETHGIVVRVEPQYLPDESTPDENHFVWAYTIEIENRSPNPVQLISRLWRITDANGVTQEVAGAGVVGKQPKLEPGQSFRYTSACPLNAPSGVMVGFYSMVRSDTNTAFDINVPPFALDSPHQTQRAN